MKWIRRRPLKLWKNYHLVYNKKALTKQVYNTVHTFK